MAGCWRLSDFSGGGGGGSGRSSTAAGSGTGFGSGFDTVDEGKMLDGAGIDGVGGTTAVDPLLMVNLSDRGFEVRESDRYTIFVGGDGGDEPSEFLRSPLCKMGLCGSSTIRCCQHGSIWG
jgi:hypothetical protein